MSTAGFHITEDCAEVYLQNESGMEFLQLARRLHDYLQQGQRLPARSLFEATDGCKEISREAFDALAKHRMENTGEVSGLFELDFDARTLSALNSQSLQMAERALLSPDELKSLPKGEFVVMKTGTHPMRTKLQLYFKWGIKFEEPYQTPERAQREVYYAGKEELLMNNCFIVSRKTHILIIADITKGFMVDNILKTIQRQWLSIALEIFFQIPIV
mgnify:CR=1 FL=1